MNIFSGTFTALITPFRQGEVDYASLERLVDQQIQGGITGFVVNGTTAESPTLAEKDVEQIFKAIRQQVGPQVPLILGTGSNSTEKSCEATQKAKKWGADGALVVVPYYNKPPQRGLVQHFTKVAASADDLPILLYNVPGRTITALELSSIHELSKVSNIVGIKEASGSIEFAREIRRVCGEKFTLLSGDDGTYGDFLAAGGDGVISVASHPLPQVFSDWTKAAMSGDKTRGQSEISEYLTFINLLFMEANPIPVKKAMQLMGVIASAELRLPLVELHEEGARKLSEEMRRLGVLP